MFMACKAVSSKDVWQEIFCRILHHQPLPLDVEGKGKKGQGNKRCSITQSFSQTFLFFFFPVSHLSCSTDRMREKALTLTYKDKEELFRDSRVTDAPSLDSSSSSHLIRQIYMLKQGKAKRWSWRWDMRETRDTLSLYDHLFQQRIYPLTSCHFPSLFACLVCGITFN